MGAGNEEILQLYRISSFPELISHHLHTVKSIVKKTGGGGISRPKIPLHAKISPRDLLVQWFSNFSQRKPLEQNISSPPSLLQGGLSVDREEAEYMHQAVHANYICRV